jgi:prepilin-type N-terminal cleavage/methylation domain-containing protein
MKLSVFHHPLGIARRAFSLLELLVALSLLSILVLALYAMFDQTQKALHASVGQVDVMEAGRSAMDLLARDIQQAQSPNLLPSVNSKGVLVTNINLAIRKRTFTDSGKSFDPLGINDVAHRDFPLNELFFLTPYQGNQWTAIGYFVANSQGANLDPDDTLGTLYRYQEHDSAGNPLTEAARGADAAERFLGFYKVMDAKNGASIRKKGQDFISADNRRTNSTRLIDNVLFFHVLPFASTGVSIDTTTPRNFFTNSSATGIVLTNQNLDLLTTTTFVNSALPSALEVELGMLSPRLWTQYTNQANFSLKTNFLAKHAADILVFRQRIPLRTALQ